MMSCGTQRPSPRLDPNRSATPSGFSCMPLTDFAFLPRSPQRRVSLVSTQCWSSDPCALGADTVAPSIAWSQTIPSVAGALHSLHMSPGFVPYDHIIWGQYPWWTFKQLQRINRACLGRDVFTAMSAEMKSSQPALRAPSFLCLPNRAIDIQLQLMSSQPLVKTVVISNCRFSTA